MKLHISYYAGAPGILDGQIEAALTTIAMDYSGDELSADWAVIEGSVYRQLVFEIPGGLEIGGPPGRFCRQACEYLEYRGSLEPKFGLAMDTQ